jgi:hypothetical protein
MTRSEQQKENKMSQPSPSIRTQLKKLASYTSELASENKTRLDRLSNNAAQANELIAAIIKVLGETVVESALEDLRAEATERHAQQQAELVRQLESDGILVPCEAIAADGFVVGADLTKEGKVLRAQFEVSSVADDVLPLYLGKGVGDKVEANGATLRIDAIYRIDRAKAEAAMNVRSEAAASPQ